jgi:hypothetical protein
MHLIELVREALKYYSNNAAAGREIKWFFPSRIDMEACGMGPPFGGLGWTQYVFEIIRSRSGSRCL